MEGLADYLLALRADLERHPCASLILAARYLLMEFDRDDIPDWVAALAGANFDLWKEAIGVARDDMASLF